MASNHVNQTRCIFSVDVEDWFHILDLPSTPDAAVWDSLPSRVEKNFLKLLDLFAEADARVTCFFLGWVARKFPHLVREAERRGHEIASHGMNHRLVYDVSREEFRRDALVSREVLEDTIGRAVLGYRSAGFSMTERTPWMLEELIGTGYRYDSSVFPARRQHGGMNSVQRAPFRATTSAGEIVEFPVSVASFIGRPTCFFGGGYLRLFPYFLVRAMTYRVLREKRPVIFYVHPREIDPAHPRLPMGMGRRFKSYVNLKTTEPKIRKLLSDFEVETFRDFLLREMPEAPTNESWASNPPGQNLTSSSEMVKP